MVNVRSNVWKVKVLANFSNFKSEFVFIVEPVNCNRKGNLKSSSVKENLLLPECVEEGREHQE